MGLKLKFIGIDDWDRPVFEDVETGQLWKDCNLGMGSLWLCTASDFYGEPAYPISDTKYKNYKVVIIK